MENVSLDLHLGWNIFDGKSGGGAFGIGDVDDPESSYIDYSVGLGTSGMGLDWGIALIGTNLSKSECFDGFSGCDTTVVVSVSKKPVIERKSFCAAGKRPIRQRGDASDRRETGRRALKLHQVMLFPRDQVT